MVVVAQTLEIADDPLIQDLEEIFKVAASLTCTFSFSHGINK
jgi:hypothetical protein